jgi:protein gp37
MAEHTNIGWTTHTWNAWHGCTEVSPACDNCYARVVSKRMGKDLWGSGKPRMRTSKHNWQQPEKWNKAAERSGAVVRVFCQSMSDFFDNEVDPAWREAAWRIIRDTPHLRWQILTKRIGNAASMLPPDFDGKGAYRHVGFMATIANQNEANRDLRKLLSLKFEKRVSWVGVSIEPMLEPIDLTAVRYRDGDCDLRYNVLTGEGWIDNSHSADAYVNDAPRLDWVIIGGESGKGEHIRAFELVHAGTLLSECKRAGVAAFFKQMGSKPTLAGKPFKVPHWKGENPAEWPIEFQVQEFPAALQ